MLNAIKRKEYKLFLNKLKEEIASAKQKAYRDVNKRLVEVYLFKGFSQENLWRMKKIYETYKDHPKLSPLVTVLSWSSNLLILFQETIDRFLLIG